MLEGLGSLRTEAKMDMSEARQGALREANDSQRLLGESSTLVATPLGKSWSRQFEAGRQFGRRFIQQRHQNYVEGAACDQQKIALQV